jgi:CRP-like cAMP-binding protein
MEKISKNFQKNYNLGLKHPYLESVKGFIMMQQTKAVQQFQKIDFFSPLNETLFELLLSQMEMKKLLPGEVVLTKGQQNEHFFFIEKGAIKFQEDKDILALLDGGKFFGEMALLGSEERNLTAIVVMDTMVWKISRERFIETLSPEPKILANVICKLTERLMKQNISTLAKIKLREKELIKENAQLTRDLEEGQEELDLLKRKLKIYAPFRYRIAFDESLMDINIFHFT